MYGWKRDVFRSRNSINFSPSVPRHVYVDWNQKQSRGPFNFSLRSQTIDLFSEYLIRSGRRYRVRLRVNDWRFVIIIFKKYVGEAFFSCKNIPEMTAIMCRHWWLCGLGREVEKDICFGMMRWHEICRYVELELAFGHSMTSCSHDDM